MAAYVDSRAMNRRHVDESGTFVPVPNPSLALQASMAREVSFPNGANTSGGGTDLKLHRLGDHARAAFVLAGFSC